MSSECLEECEKELKVILRELRNEISYQIPSKYGGTHQIENFLNCVQFVMFYYVKMTEEEQYNSWNRN